MKKLLYLLIFHILLFNHVYAGQMSSLLSNSVLLCHFNEGSGSSTRDEINKTRASTLTNIAWVDGIIGKCIYFNGSNAKITYPDSADWNIGSGNFTIIQFVKFDNGSIGTAGNVSLAQGASTSNRFYIQIIGPAATPGLRFVITNSNSYFTFDSSYNFQPLRWYMISITRSGTIFKSYVNGIKINIATSSYTINDWTSALCIGSDTVFTGGSSYFKGWIDETCIIKNKCLSEGQISNIYNNIIGRKTNE